MDEKELSRYCLDSLSKAGTDKSIYFLNKSKKYELNVEGKNISLIRTTFNTDLSLVAIKDGKKGNIHINKIDKEAVDEAITNVIQLADTSGADDANDVSPEQPYKEFVSGDEAPDKEEMYEKLKTFINQVNELYPEAILLDTILDFTLNESHYYNSNNAEYRIRDGLYNIFATIVAKKENNSSSFNYTMISAKKLDKELLECGTFDTIIKQSIEQIYPKALDSKFIGDVIITPDCLYGIIQMYVYNFLSDKAIVTGTSALKDKLNESVASPKLTLHSKPVSDEIANGYFITEDGFEAKNLTIIDKGVLRSFLLSLYGSKKTGKDIVLNSGGCYVIEPGEKTLDEIIKSVDKGILLSRFSGGNPSSNGDFSGVAKNSFYIENGKIKYPIAETMVSGNLLDLFKNIKEISHERADYGFALLPWIQSSGVTISGK